MAAQGKKKQKMKGTKMALTDFLSDDKTSGPDTSSNSYGGGSNSYGNSSYGRDSGSNSYGSSSYGRDSGSNSYGSSSYGRDRDSRGYGGKVDWAAEMESLSMDDMGDPEYGKPMIDRSKLPTAPKASRDPDVDMSQVPTSGPFTAFIGNLPYEASEESIEEFFQKLNVVNVRLPNDGGRLRGFGYVELADRQSLIDALSMNEETMGGRQIRVDLAGQNQQNERGGSGGGFEKRENDGPDRTESDWRRRDPQQEPAPSAHVHESERPGAWGSNRGDGGPPSRGGFDNDRGSFERGPPRGGGGFSRYEEAPSRDRYDDRGPQRGGGYNRDERGPSRGFDRYDDRGGRDSGFGGNRGRGYGRYEDGRGHGDRGYNRDGGRRGYGSGYRNDDRGGYDDRSERGSQEPSQDAAKDRPRLNLQPRSKPAEEPVKPMAKTKPAENRSASIFGNAKPVDTAAKEREIEERLKKKEEEARRGYDDEKESRNYYYNNSQPAAGQSGPVRTRQNSTDKMEGRQRRLSSGSSGKGRPGPQPITSPSRSRRDSEISNNSTEVFSGGEDSKDTPKSPVSPAQREDVKLVPAPPPSVNIWEKRKVDVPNTPTSKSPPKNEPKSASPPQTETSEPAPSAWGRGRSTETHHAEEAPGNNAWAKRSHDKPQDARPAGRGESSGRGGNAWGQGGKTSPKEKVLPKSIDDMPKFENKSKQDWSDKNKFSSLPEDEDDQ
ncbi:eukaryotic translation initiation factor 4B-like isoform X2 [Mizuhopecten yessoensis]|uniref:eukaryotic translation initiation factor 4B-like isoform X2 n=1 Tax=Mizuhopecten yessoensis TaxID=6573 RepID=UPI000B45EAD6|nr:eukaryotic translation initiation factor 4B-like isoform X2 [Mizuhopecten yessoensis]